jgi:hypothetical protein
MQTGTSWDERRAHPRYAVGGRIDVVIDRWDSLRVDDISMGGLRAWLPGRVFIGDQLTVELTLPNLLQVSMLAVVRHLGDSDAVGRRCVGLQWVEGAERDLLADLIAAVATDLDEPVRPPHP